MDNLSYYAYVLTLDYKRKWLKEIEERMAKESEQISSLNSAMENNEHRCKIRSYGILYEELRKEVDAMPEYDPNVYNDMVKLEREILNVIAPIDDTVRGRKNYGELLRKQGQIGGLLSSLMWGCFLDGYRCSLTRDTGFDENIEKWTKHMIQDMCTIKDPNALSAFLIAKMAVMSDKSFEEIIKELQNEKTKLSEESV